MHPPVVRLPVAAPFAGAALLDFLHRHQVAGVEAGESEIRSDGTSRSWYARTVALPHGPGWVRLTWDGVLTAELAVDPRDVEAALAGIRHLVDAETDPVAVDSHLAADPALADLVARTPGLRVPGVLDAAEMVVRTVIGQQVSLASARAAAATISARHGTPVVTGVPGLSLLFPTPAQLAAVDPATLPMPRARGRSLVALAERIADGRLDLSDGPDLGQTRADLLACPGIGPWTADYVLMRARHAPDILLSTDLVLARELTARGITNPGRWSPYRSYGAMHLWHDFLNRPRG